MKTHKNIILEYKFIFMFKQLFDDLTQGKYYNTTLIHQDYIRVKNLWFNKTLGLYLDSDDLEVFSINLISDYKPLFLLKVTKMTTGLIVVNMINNQNLCEIEGQCQLNQFQCKQHLSFQQYLIKVK
ncbi:unnamed protein product [Paramecium sonneborni]|uniref:Uncharacterized protein n=1 Tax=Paramecium sonneborni TaxID=65129 RepID=A0A8S1LI14_9CILI|nr:unnamed protein product [Paramecium sonneborni]